MWPNLQFPAYLVSFTEEILNRKLHLLCSDFCRNIFSLLWLKFETSAHVQLTITCQYILFRDFLTRYQLENCTEGTLFINEIFRWRHESSHLMTSHSNDFSWKHFHVYNLWLEMSLSTWAIKSKIWRNKVSERVVYNSQTRICLT